MFLRKYNQNDCGWLYIIQYGIQRISYELYLVLVKALMVETFTAYFYLTPELTFYIFLKISFL